MYGTNLTFSLFGVPCVVVVPTGLAERAANDNKAGERPAPDTTTSPSGVYRVVTAPLVEPERVED